MNDMPGTGFLAKSEEGGQESLLAWCSYALDFSAGRDGDLSAFPATRRFRS